MSHLRTAALSAVLTLFGVFVSPSSADADPFDCHVPRMHCLAQERDNFTFYVDTDGSMNADGGGAYSYWNAVKDTIGEIAVDNHATGTCGGDCDDPSNSQGCDGVQLGLGFFGDDSTLNTTPPAPGPGDSRNAWRAVSVGDDRRDDIVTNLGLESAGNLGLPGIETIACPPSGAGQTDIFTCPSPGTTQVERITCPPNGGLQSWEIGCPPVGQAKVYQLGCPTMGQAQYSYIRPLIAAPFVFYSFTIGSEFVSFPSGPVPTTTSITTGLFNSAMAQPAITNNYYVYNLGASGVYFYSKTNGVPFTITPFSTFYFTTGTLWPAITGLPAQPAPNHDFEFDLNGDAVTYSGGPAENTNSVCVGLMNAVNAMTATQNVSATVVGTSLVMTSTVPGDDFAITSIDPSLINVGTTTPNLPGLPGAPSAGYEFDFRVNGTKMAHNHIGTAETPTNVCNQLAAAVNGTGGLNVSATVTGDRITLESTLAGQSFNVTSVDGQLTNYGQVNANGPGLPATPPAGTDYNFRINGTDIDHIGTPTSSTSSICTALYNEILLSGEPVTPVLSFLQNTITITSSIVGLPFSITSFPSELSKTVLSAGVAGLPGTPGAGFTYTFDYTNVDSVTVPISAPGVNTTTANVCASVASALNLNGNFVASATASTVTVSPSVPGASWNFSNLNGAGLSKTSSISGLPASPGPYHNYRFQLDGTWVEYTDDGSPVQSEICAGLAAALNTWPGSPVTAVSDGTKITMTGKTSAGFIVSNKDSNLGAHIVVQQAGLGPSAFGDLGERINANLTVNDRTQNAVIITHRPPQNYADLSNSVAALCARRDNGGAPGTTHVIGMGLSASELNLMNVLAAAGGSGSCSVDPCVTLALVVSNPTMSVLTSCSGAIPATVSDLKSKINNLITKASCTLDLDVPPSYAGGQAPNDPSVIDVEIQYWNLSGLSSKPKVFTGWGWGYGHYLWGRGAWHSVVHNWDYQGWNFVAGDRSKITFTGKMCQAIRDGDITQIQTEVGCQCANQGEECTATTTLMCKNPADVAGPQITCNAEQLLGMRCATGVYICTDGVQECSAMGTNTMPEICNGIDDDCDGIIDNMSNSDIALFAGRDIDGKNCNFRDTCMCEPGDIGTSALGGIDAHLASDRGSCVCGESLEGGYSEENYTAAGAYDDSAEPSDDPTFEDDNTAACSVGMSPPSGGFLALSVLGLLAIGRRRRR